MCTVTYIPRPTGFILTSSRDEKVYRPTLLPDIYEHFGCKIVYPKDEQAGGTWIAVNMQNQIACLLNGAFENHQKQARYRKSRGLVLIESFGYENALHFKQDVNLIGVEPFTLLLIRNDTFHELRWDGSRKYFKEIDRTQPAIWSSATLYDQNTRNQREKWFYNWLKVNDHAPDFNIAQFHSSSHGNDSENDIMMKRHSGLQTLSISKIRYENKKSKFLYFDLQSREEYSIFLNHDQEPA
jgi:hypothetical protein